MTFGLTTVIDLTIEKGSDFYIPFQFNAALLTALGEADIAAYSTLMSIRDTDSLSSTYYQSVVGTVTDAASRKGRFFVTDTINELLGVGVAGMKHDMWRTDPDFEFCFGKGAYLVTTNRRVP